MKYKKFKKMLERYQREVLDNNVPETEPNKQTVQIYSDDDLGWIPWLETEYPETHQFYLNSVYEQLNIFSKKHHDYGPDNLVQESFEDSFNGIALRIKDKLNRIPNLISKGSAVENESLDDNLNDIIIYTQIIKMMYSGVWGK